jgi:hypothetical protein
VFSNPPYDRSLHLKIAESALKNSDKVIFIHPARWFEDPIAVYKKGGDKWDNIKNRLNNFMLFNPNQLHDFFDIGLNGDLMISIFGSKTSNVLSPIPEICRGICDKILNYSFENNLEKRIESQKREGIRVEIKEMCPIPNDGSNAISKRMVPVEVTSKKYYINGLDENGLNWSEGRAKNKYSKGKDANFAFSIKFETTEEAENFVKSSQTNFYKNFIHMIKFDMHAPLKLIPFMNDYSKEWTNEDFCKFFNLNEEESKFMCREVYDYREKDFIKYGSLFK